MRKQLLFGFLLSFSFLCLVAQESRTIRGIVTSAEDGSLLTGVSIFIKGTTRGTVTDIDGAYTLSEVSPTQKLVFTFIGFVPYETTANNTQINVSLETDTKLLDEVVVTALGVKRQKREIGYSTESVDGATVERSNAPNIVSALTGRAAGVQVSNANGVEGGSTRITIRGNNNLLTNNQPLFVVDGVPMENVPGLESIGRGTDWGNEINNLTAMDVADVSILKGGAASALYGARGANGVILITTKQGNVQKGLGLTYNMNYKINSAYRFRDVQNTYGHGGPISFTPAGFPADESGDTLLYPGIYGTDNLILNQAGDVSTSAAEFGYYGSGVSWGPKMEGQMIRWWDGEMRSWSPQPDNYKSVYQQGTTQTHNVAIAGGSEKGQIRVSVTNQNHKPIIENSKSNQTNISLNGALHASDKLSVDVSANYVNYSRLNSPALGDEQNSFSKGYLYSWGRSYKGIDKENYELETGAQNPQQGYPFLYVSPQLWWMYYNNNTTLNRDKYTGSISLNYNPFSWLNIFGRIGRDYSLSQFETRHKPTDVIGLVGGRYENALSRNIADNMEFMVSAEKKQLLNTKVNVKFTLGGSQWTQSYYYMSGKSGKWYFPNMYTFFNYTETTYYDDQGQIVVEELGNTAEDVATVEDLWKRQTNSLYAFLNLSYSNFIFLDITGRNDISSTLPVENNSYYYPSASLSFIASEAFHIGEYLPWFNFLKIRGGIAQTASDDDVYNTEFYYNTGFFGGAQTSNYPGTIPPFKLKPQRVNSYEVGTTMGFLDNRIDVDFTYYYIYSFDQIIEADIPYTSGAGRIKINEGVLSNKGIEFIINAVPVRTSNLIFRTGINFAKNTNRIISLGENVNQLQLADIWGLNGPAMILSEGDEYGTISGYDYVYHENGQPILNDEGTKYLFTDERVPIGNATPDFIAGWTTALSYKGFTLTTLVDTKWGGDIYCGSYVIGQQTGQSPSTLEEREGGGLPYTDPDGNTSNIGVILDGVYADGTPNEKVVHYYYKYLPNAGGWGKFLSTPGILENSWIKMREIGLYYELPVHLLRKTRIFQSLSLSIVGRDLFYIYTSLPDNINPEGIMGSGNAQGFEWASMPGTRSFTFGINASF